MGARQLVPITPGVLRWAIRESGFDELGLAEEIGVPSERLQEWQTGDDKPSKTEFDALVSKLRRPTAFFFLPAPPDRAAPDVKFRRPPGSTRAKLNVKEHRYLREAARVQATISWALQELEATPKPLPEFNTKSNVEGTAAKIRTLLYGHGTPRTQGISDPALQREWRERLEAKGILVFLLPLGKDSVRGFSLYDAAAPVVAINTHWSYRPRVFSMVHELVHLLSRTSSACVETGGRRMPSSADAVERWCEGVAAAVLMPWDKVAWHLDNSLHLSAGAPVRTLEQLFKLSGALKASARAMAIRLIERGLATWELYHAIPPWREEKLGGGGGGGRDRAEIRRDEYGQRTIGLFSEAVGNGLLTAADASTFLKMAAADVAPRVRAD
jgi:Zn-dependent peptidase ImmA (M78 family)